jgi:PAS domain S-box-containing protein
MALTGKIQWLKALPGDAPRGTSRRVPIASSSATRAVTKEDTAMNATPTQVTEPAATRDDLERRLMERTAELNKAFEALRASEDRFCCVFESELVGIVFWDSAGNILEANDAFLRTVGYTRDDLRTGKISWRAMTPPELKPRDDRALAEIAVNGVCTPFEKQYIRKDGARVPIVVEAVSFPGDRDRGLAFIVDVTKDKEAQEALRESEERFRQIVENVGEVFWMIAPDTGQMLYVSAAYENIWGRSCHSLYEHPGSWVEAVHPDDNERVHAYWKKQRDGDFTGTLDIEYRIVRPDGSVRWIWDRPIPIRDPNGVVYRIAGFAVDITRRKRAETALERTAERLGTLLEISKALISTLNLNQLLERLLQRLLNVIAAADLGAISLYDAEHQVLNPAACWGFDTDAFSRIRFRLGEAMAGKVFQSGEAMLTRTQEETERRRGPMAPENAAFFARACGGQIVVSQAGVPLRAPPGEVIGTIVLGSTSTALTSDDLLLLEGVAALAGVAIHNARLFEQVHAGQQRLGTLSRRLVEVQEADRRDIGRELHDEVGQLLTGLNLTLQMCARAPADDGAAGLAGAQALTLELMAKVRELSLHLRPTMLDDLGLLPTLLWHFERFTAQTHVRVAFEHSGLDQRFLAALETAAYRIVQESLTNAARHAGGTEVAVRVWADAETLSVQVEDRGPGFDPQAVLAAGASSGLTGMRERAFLLGGQLTVESAPNQGTRLTAVLPLGGWNDRDSRGA